MLQRVQSVYFLLSTLLFYALFLFPLLHNVYVDGKPVSIMVTGVYQDVNGQWMHTQFFVALTIATAIIGLIPLIIIFLYKNRKRQIFLGYAAMLIIIAYSYWLAEEAKQVVGSIQLDTHTVGIGIFLSTISLFFLMLAIKAIQRDEKLIKSADRLR